ncbi:helix-turn-helix domain-containing protein [Bradyrhizobium sp. USDA 4506]
MKNSSRCGLSLPQTAIDIGNGISFLRTSDRLGWPNLHAALTEEQPHEARHDGIPSLWLAMVLSQADICRNLGCREEHMIMQPGRISIVGPKTPLAVRLKSTIRALHITLKDELFNEVASELFDGASTVEVVPTFGAENRCMEFLLRSVVETLHEPAHHSGLKIEYLSRALASAILGKYAVLRRPGIRADSRLSAHQTQRVQEYIREHLSSNISLNELAAVAGVNRAAFIRRFTGTLNTTPHQYLTRVRLKRGQDLLSESDLPLAQIASVCGFADHAHFTTVFKRALGIVPSAYRRQCS